MKLSSPLIGLGGRLRSGKDVVADRLVAEHGYVKLGMSDALHEAMLAIDPWVAVPLEIGRFQRWILRVVFRRQDEIYDFERYSALVRSLGYVEAKKNPEVRRLLQQLGTDVGRKMIGEDVWVNIMARKIDDHRSAGHPVVVTGLRFANEVQIVEELAGMAVWIDRPGEHAPSSGTAAHASENSVSAENFHLVITNDSTLAALEDQADGLARGMQARG